MKRATYPHWVVRKAADLTHIENAGLQFAQHRPTALRAEIKGKIMCVQATRSASHGSTHIVHRKRLEGAVENFRTGLCGDFGLEGFAHFAHKDA
jgi:hypothetical protein